MMMTRPLLALLAGVCAGASFAASQIPSFRGLTPPGTPTLTFAALLLGIEPAAELRWASVWVAALPGLCVSLLQTFLAVWLGAGLLTRFLPSLSGGAVWGIGVLPGSLLLILGVRLAADVARLTSAEVMPILLAVVAAAGAAAAWRLRPPLPDARSTFVSLFLLLLLLVFGVQFGGLHVTGDSSNLIHAALAGATLPRLPLHHGDVLWSMPAQILSGGTPETSPHWLTSLWIWHGAGRLALIWAVWLALGALLPRRPAFERASLVTFLCLGAHTMIPWHSPLVFNSGSPPLFALHPDTWGAIALAWGAAARVRWRLHAGLLGLAAPLVSISVLLGGAIAAVGTALRRAPTAPAGWLLLCTAVLPGVLPLLPSGAGLALTGAAATAAAALLLRSTSVAATTAGMGVLASAFLAGTLLVGGLFDPLPDAEGRALLAQARGLLFGPDGRPLDVFGLSAPGIGAPNPYCGHFAGAFCADAPQAFLRLGLPAALLAVALWLHPLPRRPTGIGASLVLTSGALAAGIAMVHWGYPSVEQTGFHPMASWLRTRLLEPGWMMALLLGVVLLARRLPPRVSAALAGVWTLAPMTQDELPVQIWINARWLLFGP
jgi:hypothetical protein